MTTGAQLVAIGKQWFYEPYWNYDDTRFGPFRMDCSGYMVRILRAAGDPPPGNALNSEGLDLWGRNQGLEIPLDEAYGIPGALVSRWGVGDNGHIAMSQGDGQRTIETPAWGMFGHASGEASIQGRDWTNANLCPGIDYTGKTPAVNLAALAQSIVSSTRIVLHYGESDHPVATKWLQIMLNRACPRVPPLIVDGVYGVVTLHRLLSWELNAEKFLHLTNDNILPDSGNVTPSVWFWLRAAAHI